MPWLTITAAKSASPGGSQDFEYVEVPDGEAWLEVPALGGPRRLAFSLDFMVKVELTQDKPNKPGETAE